MLIVDAIALDSPWPVAILAKDSLRMSVTFTIT